jgi:two-component system, NarL family, invasion response regulator UvrY
MFDEEANMRKVFLADDHAIVLQGVRRLIENEGSFVVVGEAQHAREVLKRASAEHWDLLVLDLSLPGGGGLEVLSRLKQLRPAVRVVVYSMYSEAQYANAAIEAGARGYVCKVRKPEALVDALHVVSRGGVFISGDPDETAGAGEALTQRETQVLHLLSESRSPSDIAKELAVSRSTVSTHIGQLKRKLNVSTVPGLVRYALQNTLVKPDSN